MTSTTLTPAAACAALRSAGLSFTPEEVEIVAGEERWAALLPGARIAWFPASERGARRLAVERRVLQLVAARCSFAVPRPLFVSDGGIDVREMVPGRCDPWSLFERCRKDPALARAVGLWFGTMLAEQHTRIHAADVAGWLPERVAWPESADWIMQRLPDVVQDGDLIARVERAAARYEAVAVAAEDRVLIHGDIGLHNLAIDPESGAVNGIFDYDSAAWADRHHDFRYLLFDVGREDMLDAALEVYEPAAGRSIDRARVRLSTAACAMSYLAFRKGIPPDRPWCGRTLADDIRWVSTALAAIGL